MLLNTLAMAVATRFSKGVHNKEDCGSNTQGYAAISAATKYTDLHNLDNYFCESAPYNISHKRKRSIAGQDTIVFLLIKLMESAISPTTYILLLSKETPIFGGLDTIVSALSSAGNCILFIESINDSYHLTLFFNKSSSSICIYDHNTLLEFVHNLSSLRGTALLTYPDVTEWVNTINQINPTIWCTPTRKDEVWVSCDGSDSYTHFVFPWSGAIRCRGYTIGQGKIKLGTMRERLRYEGRFNFYNGMISSVPIGSSCTDCMAMQNAANSISKIALCNDSPPTHRLSVASIKALDELDARLKEFVK
jgi:hypothetical protein